MIDANSHRSRALDISQGDLVPHPRPHAAYLHWPQYLSLRADGYTPSRMAALTSARELWVHPTPHAPPELVWKAN